MSTSFQSPPSPLVFTSNETSPPPTPGRKRPRISEIEKVPLFFPISRSIFGSEECTNDNESYVIEDSHVTSFALKSRRIFGISIQNAVPQPSHLYSPEILSIDTARGIPTLPFSFNESPLGDATSHQQVLSREISDTSADEESNQDPSTKQVTKAPAFQRVGMNPSVRYMKRLHCVNAKTA